MTPIKLTVALTHPIQYYSPWLRHIATSCPAIDLTVVYATQPTPAQQGVGFDRAFEWDTPLLEGYRYRFARESRSGDDVSSDNFRGVDFPGIGDVIGDTHPDVVLVPGWHSAVLVRSLLACRRRRIPILYRGDSHLGLRPRGWRRAPWSIRTRALLRLYSAYLAVGQRSRQYLQAHGVPPTRIFASPHTVDNGFFAESAAAYLAADERARARAEMGCSAGEFVVLFVGKLNGRKRVIDLIQALAAVGPGMRLLVAGAGDAEAMLRAEAARDGVPASWLGFVNQHSLGRVYAAADCLALPSDEESWGLVVNEALATGLPVVASDSIGCAPDLVLAGRSGETFAAGDIAGFASALERVRVRGGRDRMADECRAVVAAHSFERATVGLLAACESVARTAPRRASVVACCGGMVIVAGLERMTFEVLRVARDEGCRVHCLLNDWENHRIAERAERIGASWSPSFYGGTFTRRPGGPRAVARMVSDVVRASGALLRAAIRIRPTHVFVPDYGTALRHSLALFVLRGAGVRTVFRLGNPPDAGAFYSRLWRRVINPLVDRFVCNSEFTTKELLATGVPARKVGRIYNTIPRRSVTRFDAAPRDDRRVVYVGQIIPEKGVHILLDAVGLLVGRGRDVLLDVAGNIDGWVSPSYGNYRERLRERAAAPDLSGRVRFLGWREDVPAVLGSGAVHCCPSQPEMREGFGVVTVEAKDAGVPSVVTPLGALPELVSHRVDGWVCADATAEAVAEGLDYFLGCPERARAAGAAARLSASRFGAERFAVAWAQEFSRGRQ